MASTRSKNTPGNYCLEQKAYFDGQSYLTNTAFAVHEQPCLAGDSLMAGRFSNMQLAQNPQDIESFLFGIGASNMVGNAGPLQARIFEHPVLSMMDQRRVPLVMPAPLVVPLEQRQYPIPSQTNIVRRS
jgi:hypothetical protein